MVQDHHPYVGPVPIRSAILALRMVRVTSRLPFRELSQRRRLNSQKETMKMDQDTLAHLRMSDFDMTKSQMTLLPKEEA